MAGDASVETIQFLVERNEKAVSQRDSDGNFPLHCVCATARRWEPAMLLIRKFPKAVLAENAQGNLPLHLACENPSNKELILKLLEEENHAVYRSNKRGELPIHIACRSGCGFDVIENLYSAEHFHTVDIAGNTPLPSLCNCTRSIPDTDIVTLFLGLDPSAAKKTNKDGSLPIHLFCASVRSVVNRDMSFRARSSDHYKLTTCAIRGLETLLRYNEHSCELPDNEGRTPLHIVCSAGSPNPRIVLSLLHGMPSNIVRSKDRRGYSPLHIACMQRKVSVEVVQRLARASGIIDVTQGEVHIRSFNHDDDSTSTMTENSATLPVGRLRYRGDVATTVGSDEVTPIADNRQASGSEISSHASPLSNKDNGADVDWLKTDLGDTPLHLAYRH